MHSIQFLWTESKKSKFSFLLSSVSLKRLNLGGFVLIDVQSYRSDVIISATNMQDLCIHDMANVVLVFVFNSIKVFIWNIRNVRRKRDINKLLFCRLRNSLIGTAFNWFHYHDLPSSLLNNSQSGIRIRPNHKYFVICLLLSLSLHI